MTIVERDIEMRARRASGRSPTGFGTTARPAAARRRRRRDDDDAVVSRNYGLVLKGHARSVTVNSAKAVGGVSVDVGGAATSASRPGERTAATGAAAGAADGGGTSAEDEAVPGMTFV